MSSGVQLSQEMDLVQLIKLLKPCNFALNSCLVESFVPNEKEKTAHITHEQIWKVMFKQRVCSSSIILLSLRLFSCFSPTSHEKRVSVKELTSPRSIHVDCESSSSQVKTSNRDVCSVIRK